MSDRPVLLTTRIVLRSGRGPGRGRALGLASVVALAACAAGGVGEPARGSLEPSDHEVVVRIRNDVIPQAGVVVSVRGGARPQKVLGILPAGDTQEWLVDTRSFAGSFILIARIDGRRVLATRSIQAMSLSTITWDLNSGNVRVRRVGG